MIRLEIPQLTEERRKEFGKKVSKHAEEAKVAIRNLRRDCNDLFKKAEKKKEITEDESKEAQTKIQKMTDQKIKDIDALKDKKTKEVMEV
ncbi:ribosome-recycling factor, partial [Megasphaera sp. DJF_B143]